MADGQGLNFAIPIGTTIVLLDRYIPEIFALRSLGNSAAFQL
jgi:hypothetical protein